jgi:hypothetical protein
MLENFKEKNSLLGTWPQVLSSTILFTSKQLEIVKQFAVHFFLGVCIIHAFHENCSYGYDI